MRNPVRHFVRRPQSREYGSQRRLAKRTLQLNYTQ